MAAIIGIIQVNIGHGDAPRIKEPLEDEAIGQGINAGDAQCVRHHRTRPRTAHIPPDVVLFPLLVTLAGVKLLPIGDPPIQTAPGKLRQIPHNQEVGLKPHLADDV